MREKTVKVFFHPVIYGIAVFAAQLMMIGGSRDVLAADCDTISPPHLAIEITKSEVQEFFDITSADLQRIAAARGIRPPWPGLGVTRLILHSPDEALILSALSPILI
jgi:hypothetical protein